MDAFLLGKLRNLGTGLGLIALGACGQPDFNEADTSRRIQPDEFVTKSFKAGEVLSTTISLQPQVEAIDQTITLSAKPAAQQSFRQINRPVISERLYQGHTGYQESENLPITEAGRLDLLVIIDDSSSMRPFQDLLRVRFQNLLSNISNTDWHIAVATTSSSCLRSTGEGIKILTRQDYEANPLLTQQRFEALITPGEVGSTIERGILAATEGLIGDCGNPNQSWVRFQAQQAVLIVSDEKNCGSASNEGCQGQPYEVAEYFLRRVPGDTRVYGLFLLDNNPLACPQSGGYDDYYPTEYMRLVEATGGFAEEICQVDYSGVLDRVSAHVRDFVKTVFTLKYIPVPDSLTVSIDGRPVRQGLRVEGNLLYVDAPIQAGDRNLSVIYRHNPIPMQQSFALNSELDKQTLSVNINGKPMPRESFVWDTNNNTLSFNEIPAARSVIEVNYRKPNLLQESFPLMLPDDVASVEVRVNQKKVPEENYELSSGRLDFKNPPSDNADINVTIERRSDWILSYEMLDLDQNDLKSINIIDAATEDTLNELVEIKDGWLQLSEEAYEKTNALLITYQLKDWNLAEEMSLVLPQTVIEESVAVRRLSDAGICDENLAIRGGKAIFTCIGGEDSGFELTYRFIEGFRSSFLVDPDHRMTGPWKVSINGKQIYDFIQEDSYLHIPEDYLKPGDVITVKAYVGPQ